jgi:predicted signal transduction protein with EAL and GGDEF domain
MTSLTDPLEVVTGLESGADNFLRKPYQPDQLVGRVRAALRNQELRRTGEGESGIRLSFLDREFAVDADRSQMLDLLVSTFEELVTTARELQSREVDLVRAHGEVRKQLAIVDLERSRLAAVFDAVPVPLFVIGSDRIITHASDAVARTFGKPSDEVFGRPLQEVAEFRSGSGALIPAGALPPLEAIETGRAARAGASFDVFLARPDGTRVPVVLEASPVLSERGKAQGSVATAHVLGSLAQHDPVTGLPNHVAFLEKAASALPASHGGVAMLLIQVDRLESARVASGHETTKQLVADLSERLREVFDRPRGGAHGAESFLAYLGTGQFGALLSSLPESFGVLPLADAARRVVAEVRTDGLPRVTGSVGAAVADGVDEASQLFAAATAALRRAQDGGGNRVELFGEEASKEAVKRLQLEADLQQAVEGDAIELHYQPELDLETGVVVGFEALARWTHPRSGPVRPDIFIDVAEQSGLIHLLGRQLLSRACKEASTWPCGADGRPVAVSVNVSAVQLGQGFPAEVLSVLQESGLAPSRLVLEVTETAAMTDPEVTLPLLHALREQGVRLSLDDFGTGHSSLALLTRMHLDQLKLDRGFVSGLDENPRDAVVARTIAGLGGSLGIPVLAEGIETEAQAAQLHRIGCAQGQGYLFARPMPPEEVPRYLARVEWSRAAPRPAGQEA